jgi:hypothetical protein
VFVALIMCLVNPIELKHPQIDWPLLLCDDDLPDALHRLLRLGEQLLYDIMLEAKRRATKQLSVAKGSLTCMQNLADALDAKEFQGAFPKVCIDCRDDGIRFSSSSLHVGVFA